MNTISVGIISRNRKLRFCYKMLLSQCANHCVHVVLEGTSIHELGGEGGAWKKLDVLLLDSDQVIGSKIYFNYLRDMFDGVKLILLCDDPACASAYGNLVDGTLDRQCSAHQLVAAIRKAVVAPPVPTG